MLVSIVSNVCIYLNKKKKTGLTVKKKKEN